MFSLVLSKNLGGNNFFFGFQMTWFEIKLRSAMKKKFLNLKCIYYICKYKLEYDSIETSNTNSLVNKAVSHNLYRP